MNRYKFDETQHLHTLDGKALTGTSTALKVLSKPLSWWASGKALELMGWTATKAEKQSRIDAAANVLGNIKKMGVKEYLALIDKAYRNHKDSLDKSASKGTDLHAELERYIKWIMSGKKGLYTPNERIVPFVEWSEKNVKKFLWSEAHCYSERLWTGGIADAGAILNDDSVTVIDFKSSKEAYTSQFIQCAGYALALEENGLFDKDGNFQFKVGWNFDKFIIFPFGQEKLEPWENDKPIDELKKGFENAVQLYRLLELGKEY